MAEENDRLDNTYLLSRQIAHEYNGNAFQNWFRAWKANFSADVLKPDKPQEAGQSQFIQDQRQLEASKIKDPELKKRPELSGKVQQKTTEATTEVTSNIETPDIDPVTAFAGGFAGMGKVSLEQGLKLLPSLGRAMTSGVVSTATEFPIGLAAEQVAEDFPQLSLPFSIATGLLSGATIERAIERGVQKAAQKAGTKLSQIDLKQQVKFIQDTLASETGAVKLGPDEDAMLKAAIKEVDAEIAGADIPKPKIGLTEASERFFEVEPEISEKISKSGKIRKFAGNINLSRIENPEELSDVYGKTVSLFSQELRQARRGYRSNIQTQKAADLLGMTPKQLLSRRQGQAFSAEEVTAARFLLASSAENLSGLAQRIKGADATDIDKFEFRKALNAHYALQSQVSGATAEAGRALQAFRISAKAEPAKVKQINEFLQNAPGRFSTEELADKLSDMENLEQLNTFARQAQRATTKDMLYEVWINGLLSGPQTHAVNTLSNSLVALWQIPERFLASTFSKEIGAREALSQAYGLTEGAKDGFKLFFKAILPERLGKKIEGEPIDTTSKIETRQRRSITAENVRQLPVIRKIAPNSFKEGGVAAHFADFIGHGVRLPGRFLEAEDDLFKTIGYRMELRAQAFRKATFEEGLKGRQAATRMQEIINDPQIHAPDVHAASIDAARYQTFTNELGEAGRSVQKALNSVPGLRLIVPFMRTPANIVKFTFERTPLALASRRIREDISAGGARRDLAMSRIAIGSMTMGAMGTLAAEGTLTGGGPSDHKLRQFKFNQGWQPYSIKIGNKYYSYGRLEPLGMLFGMAADFVEVAGEMSEEERKSAATMIVTALSQNLMSKTWLRGLSEAVTALDDPQRYGEKWWNRFAGSTVPALFAQVERKISPEMEYARDTLTSIKARIPGYSNDLPKRRNLWGEAIVFEGGLGPDIASPIYTKTVKESPIDKELLRLRIPLSMPRKVQNIENVPIELNDEEYEQFLILMNETKLDSTDKVLKSSLNQLVRSADYKEANTDQKETMIRAQLTEAKQLAKGLIINEYPYLRTVIAEMNKIQANQ